MPTQKAEFLAQVARTRAALHYRSLSSVPLHLRLHGWRLQFACFPLNLVRATKFPFSSQAVNFRLANYRFVRRSRSFILACDHDFEFSHFEKRYHIVRFRSFIKLNVFRIYASLGESGRRFFPASIASDFRLLFRSVFRRSIVCLSFSCVQATYFLNIPHVFNWIVS